MSTTSPNMGLTVPTPSTGVTGTGDTGPGYATNITNDLNTIDSHDHSSGKGVQVTPAGMNINADLAINSNNLTSIKGARFTSQASALNQGGDVSEVYVKSGDLWFVNSSGVQVQVTAGSALGTGPAGPQGAAGQSFVSNYFQAGVTGYTGMNLNGGSGGMVTWTQLQLQSGNITQPTGSGTGAAWINIGAAGLYEVSYALGFTGSAGACQANVLQTLNATGSIGGGTAIAASVNSVRGSLATGSLTAAGTYIVQLAQGVNIETWVSFPTGAPNVALSPTGTSFTITKIG